MISYPPTTPSQPPMPAPAPATAVKTNGRRYQVIFGAVFAALTALALALAAIAPDLGPAPSRSATAGWAPVYERSLTTADSAAWDITHGCAFTARGLDANAPGSDTAICAFTPSGDGGVTGAGFYFELKLAPAAQVPVFQKALLLMGDFSSQAGNTLTFEIDQLGEYTLCAGDCSAAGQGLYISGGTAAWHSDAFVANTIAVRVSADHARETIYVNGQQVASVSVDMGPAPALAAGAPSGSEAIFTHATLSTGQ